MVDTVLGSYRIIDSIGKGGMGHVYLAEHTLLRRRVAIKTLLPALSANQDAVRRFFNEAKATTALKHPGVVDIYDFGFDTDGTAFIVMEYLSGQSLAERLKVVQQPSILTALEITRQVASALAHVHSTGVIHRDLKPDNIFLTPDPEIGERVKILDFGIAKLHQPQEDSASGTRTGTILGTPLYMAPEQCRGAGHVDHRVDLYSLGCILFEMICTDQETRSMLVDATRGSPLAGCVPVVDERVHTY